MRRTAGNQITWLWRLLAPLGVLLALAIRSTAAQPASSVDNHYELDETVDLDRAPGPVLTQLERIKACLADRQWDEAAGAISQLMEDAGDPLLPVAKNRYVSVRDYCQMQLTAWPREALAAYRGRVDPLAEAWYREGIARRDPQPLLQVVEDAFASSWADDALAALGEMALEEGDFDSARAYWEKILPVETPAGTLPARLRFPDTHLDLAAVCARLALASILEGATDRAQEELAALARSHPNARGPLAGREVNPVEALRALLAESRSWPEVPHSADWLTFAGTPWRNKIAPRAVDVRDVAWRVDVRETMTGNPSRAVSARNSPGALEDPVLANNDAPLSFHPVLSGNLVLLNTGTNILALDVWTGKPAWGRGPGILYREESAGNPIAAGEPPPSTATVHDGKLYARMGAAVIGPSPGSTAEATCLVCLDLRSEGRLLWRIAPDEPAWAFEGSPVCDGRNVYVAMRRSDVRPQAHVACFDAETGQRRWRRFIGSADTSAHGLDSEITHHLLTLKRDALYYNTNLGAVAALSTREGAVQWITLYPRAGRGNLAKPAPYARRDLTPCLVHRGMVLVAPADSPRIFALDAVTGEILWQTGTEVEDVVHLLGVAGDQLIASGGRLYWIGLKADQSGRINHVWPEGDAAPGYGRGILAADRVYFPTREQVYVFDQATARSEGVIDLVPRGAGGGNLLVSNAGLLIATGKELIALGGRAGKTH